MRRILSFLFFICLFFAPIMAYASCPYKIVQEPKGVYVIEIISSKSRAKLQPVIVSELETNFDVYKRVHPRFIVNAGFFDPKNQKTVSYVTIDGQVVLDPKQNESLMGNAALKPYLPQILNRSEFRILEDDKGKILYDISAHNDVVPEGYKIKHSIQAGPMLVPSLKLEEEFFVLKRNGKIISESASSLHKYARTAIGIKNNRVFIIIATNDAPMTLEELANFARNMGLEKAMAFDGGGSTSFDSQELHIISEKDNQARKLKSFLMLK